MNAMALLVGLLVVAYGGNMLKGGRALSGYGLPSGSEWLLLGFVLGPEVLGVLPTEVVDTFRPLLGLAIAWMAFVFGAEYGYSGERRATAGRFAIGLCCAFVCAAISAAIVFVAATRLAHWEWREAAYVAVAFGLASCETARYAVRWAVAQSEDTLPMRRLLEDLSDTDEAVPLLGLAALFALTPGEASSVLEPWQLLAITAGLAIALGLLSAMLLASFQRVEGAWAVLLGAAWLATGVAWGLGVSPLSVLFLLGVTLGAASRHAPALRALLGPTEPAVLLPTLLLVGGLVRIPHDVASWIVVAAALVARGVARTSVGAVLALAIGAPRHRRLAFATGLWSTGALTPLVALTCAVRFPGVAADTLFAAACLATVVGELVGPLSLRKALAPVVKSDPPPAPPKSPEPVQAVSP